MGSAFLFNFSFCILHFFTAENKRGRGCAEIVWDGWELWVKGFECGKQILVSNFWLPPGSRTGSGTPFAFSTSDNSLTLVPERELRSLLKSNYDFYVVLEWHQKPFFILHFAFCIGALLTFDFWLFFGRQQKNSIRLRLCHSLVLYHFIGQITVALKFIVHSLKV